MYKILLFSILLFIIDFISKIIVKSNLILNNSLIIIDNFFSLTYTNNYGAAFSIFENGRILFIIISIVCLIFIIVYLFKEKNISKLEKIAYPLLIGGILGNLYDRIVYGYVVDFLDFTIFKYNFAIFNFADSFIVISVIILIISSIRGDKK